MSPVRLCLLGAGRWGKRYIDTIAAMPEVSLAALASRNPQSAGLVPEGCSIHIDWRDAVAADIDGVIVATPPELHAEMALAAIAAGRPVLVEKPLTVSLAEARAIESAAKRSGVLASVGHVHLHNSGYRELKRHLAEIGPLRRIRCVAGNWGPFRPDVTPLWDWAPHDLSMCLDLAGRAPVVVTCETNGPERIKGGWGGNYRITLDFGGGLEADIRVGNMMTAKSRFIEVSGDSGKFSYDDILQTLLGATGAPLPVPPRKPLNQQVGAFAAAIRRGDRADPGLQQGVETISILEQCMHSISSKLCNTLK